MSEKNIPRRSFLKSGAAAAAAACVRTHAGAEFSHLTGCGPLKVMGGRL